jgi:glycine/D-amino acid oxidase-like deaminating enzyme
VRVAVVERYEIESLSSPRAAGMVSNMRKGDLMIEVIQLAGERIRHFTRGIGQPLSWVTSGSLKVGRRPQDVDVLQADLERGRRMGLDVVLIDPR